MEDPDVSFIQAFVAGNIGEDAMWWVLSGKLEATFEGTKWKVPASAIDPTAADNAMLFRHAVLKHLWENEEQDGLWDTAKKTAPVGQEPSVTKSDMIEAMAEFASETMPGAEAQAAYVATQKQERDIRNAATQATKGIPLPVNDSVTREGALEIHRAIVDEQDPLYETIARTDDRLQDYYAHGYALGYAVEFLAENGQVPDAYLNDEPALVRLTKLVNDAQAALELFHETRQAEKDEREEADRKAAKAALKERKNAKVPA
jgi:hypothetical protein